MEIRRVNKSSMSKRGKNRGRSTNSTNPSTLLRNAINEYELVVEEVKDAGKYKEDRYYICTLDHKNNIDRERWNKIRHKSWTNWDNVQIMKKSLESLGTHTHKVSSYTHELWVTEHEEIKRALQRLYKRDNYSSKKDLFGSEGWKGLMDLYGKRVNESLWDIDPDELTNKPQINTYSLCKTLFKIIKYAKNNEMDIDSTITAMQLKDTSIDDELRRATSNKSDKEAYEVYKSAYEVENGSEEEVP